MEQLESLPQERLSMGCPIKSFLIIQQKTPIQVYLKHCPVGIQLRFANSIAPITDAPTVAIPVFAVNANIIKHGIGLKPKAIDKLQIIGPSTIIIALLSLLNCVLPA